MRSRSLVARLAGGACALAVLLVPAAAGSVLAGSYTATSAPTDVRPSSSRAYVVQLVSQPSSTERATRAKIGIPPGFTVAAATLAATTTAAGTCAAATWSAELVGSEISLKRPGGGGSSDLCPGATLRVSFTATAAAAEGTYTWLTELTRDEPFSLVGAQPAVRVDGTAPATTIASAPRNPSNSSSASFTFSANEAAVSFECRLDGESFSGCASPKAYPELRDGMHTFEVRATDQAGNIGAATAYTWTIGTVAPLTTIESGPRDPTSATSASFTFTANAPNTTFECRLDEGNYEACTSPKSYTTLVDGGHEFEVRATDEAGNVGSPAGYAWRVDTVAPTATIVGKPANPTNAATAAFTFTTNEAGSTFECKLDSGPFAACSSPKSYAALADGSHTFEVRAVDAAENVGSPARHTWRVDTVAPSSTITATPTSPTNATTASFAFTASEAGSTFECKLDSGSFAACSSPKSYGPPLADGSHTFDVRALDAAGNTGAAARHTWVVDTAAPDTTITAKPTSPTNATTASFTFTANEAGSTFECKLDSGSFAACGSPKSYGGLAEGPHTFEVRAVDRAGNRDGSPGAYSWSVDTTPPETTIVTAPNHPTNVRSPSFAFSANEGGSSFECKLDAGPFEACSSPKSYGSLEDGPHTFEVRATDAAANTGAAVGYAWTIDTVAPSVTLASPVNGGSTNDDTPTYSGAAGSAAGDSATVTVNVYAGTAAGGAPAQTLVASREASSWSVVGSVLPDGVYTVRAEQADAAGNTGLSQANTFTIDTSGPPTTIVAKPRDPSNDRSPSFAFTSPDAVAFECRLDGGAYAPCTSPAGYSGLPDGRHTFRVRATDATENTGAEASYSWTVDTVAPTASITPGEAPRGRTQERTARFVFAANEPGSQLTCRLDGGAFAPCTSPATYSALPDGDHTFLARATDPAGNTGSPAGHTWVVDNRPPAVLIAEKPADPTNAPTATFGFSADEAVARFECRLDGGPYVVCTSARTYGGLADGAHTFDVRAVDIAGNSGNAGHTWSVDTVAPDTAVDSGPPSPASVRSATFAFSASEPGSRFECQVDGRAFEPCTSPATYGALADGPHRFAVRASDGAGNTDSTPAAREWTVSVAAPDATPPADVVAVAARAGDRSVALSWTLPGDPDLDRVVVSRTRAGKAASAAAVYQGTAASFTDRGLDNGVRYTYRIKAYDGAGNASAGVEVTAVPRALLLAPRRGARIATPPVLRWAAVPRATYYNVQLRRVTRGAPGVKILSAWPSSARLALRKQWRFGGRAYRLTPGVYRWYVWPGYGDRAAAKYGDLLGESSFVVVAPRR